MTKRRDLQGVFAVEPLLRTWKYDGPELQGQYINVTRRQVPLAPARVLPLYSMQMHDRLARSRCSLGPADARGQ